MVGQRPKGIVETVVRCQDRLTKECAIADPLVVDRRLQDIKVDHAHDHPIPIDDRSPGHASRLDA